MWWVEADGGVVPFLRLLETKDPEVELRMQLTVISHPKFLVTWNSQQISQQLIISWFGGKERPGSSTSGKVFKT